MVVGNLIPRLLRMGRNLGTRLVAAGNVFC